MAVEKRPADSQAPAQAVFPALGSTVVVGCTDPRQLRDIVTRVRGAIDDVDRALSRFRADSELAQLEHARGRSWLASPLFVEALDLACRSAEATDGWFDPTVRDAVEAAGYDRDIRLVERDGPGPARRPLAAGQWRRIHYDQRTRLVIVPPGVRLDFGGIGKGYAVDLALRRAATDGLGVIVAAGGDIGVNGPPPGDGWPCDVAVAPDGPAETTVLLRSGALATSGLGRRQWRRGGHDLHHLIDPRTGRPAESPWQVVSVAAKDCALAEVAAKVAWLRGTDGPAWIASLGLTARFSGRDGDAQTVGRWPTHDSPMTVHHEGGA